MCSHLWCLRSLLSVCLGTFLLLPLSCVAEAQYDYYGDTTPASDYSDYNATFDYSFYSNASSEDLDKFLSEGDVDQEEETVGEEEAEQEATVTMTTVTSSTDRGQVPIYSSASLPGTLASRMLVCSFLVLLSLTIQQLLLKL